MEVNKIQELIDEYYYWDMRVNKLQCDYFADEIRLVYGDTEGYDVIYKFTGCYKANFEHTPNYEKEKAVKDMSLMQIPYFMQDVEVGEIIKESIKFYTCKINMFPLYLEIWCKNIQVIKKKRVE